MSSKFINTAQLSRELSEYMGWSLKKSMCFLTTAVDWIKDQLRLNNRVVLSGFGVFKLNFRKEKYVKHPVSNEKIRVDAHMAPFFSSAINIDKKLNNKGC